MATTCDYCHKPLSLMRRLRGEQFCSPDHMDRFAAQQADFALERLAASVDLKPNTERPPAFPKPEPRFKHSPPSAAQSVLESVLKPLHHEVASIGQGALPEYPMAPPIEQAAAPARSMEARHRRPEFAPVENWGKTTNAWSIPRFRVEPAEIRPWNSLPDLPATEIWEETPEPAIHVAPELVAEVPLAEIEASFDPMVADPISEYRSLRPRKPGFSAQVGDVELSVPHFRAAPVVTPLLNGTLAHTSPAFATVSRAPVFLRPDRGDAQAIATLTEPEQFSSLAIQQPLLVVPMSARSLSLGEARSFALAAVPSVARTGVLVADLAEPVPSAPIAPALGFSDALTISAGNAVAFSPRPARPAVPQQHGLLGWQDLPPEVRRPAAKPVTPRLAGTKSTGTLQPTREHYTPAALPSNEAPVSIWPVARGAIDMVVTVGPSLTGLQFIPVSMQTWGGEDASQVPAALEHIAAVRVPAIPEALSVRPAVRVSARGPIGAHSWSLPRVNTTEFDAGPLMTARPSSASWDVQLRPLVPFSRPYLESVGEVLCELLPYQGDAITSPVAQASLTSWVVMPPQFTSTPVPRFGRPGVVQFVPQKGDVAPLPALAEPKKCSPAVLMVLPPPTFVHGLPALSLDARCVAQIPNGIWSLPKIKPSGYRAVGPFPKLPVRFPDSYLRPRGPELRAPFSSVSPKRLRPRVGLGSLPELNLSRPMGVHPADFLAWPAPKGMKQEPPLTVREIDEIPRTDTDQPTRRFGPGRAGQLQTRRRTADVLPRTGA